MGELFGMATRMAAALAVMAVGLSGCGGQRPLELAPVTGIVMYDGKPVEGAVVEFVQDQSPTRSMGFTNDSGQFSLTSMRPDDGAPVGKHKVLVTKRTKPARPAESPAAVSLDSISDPVERRKASIIASQQERPPAAQAAAQRTSQATSPKDLLPTKYAKHETSDLEFVVEPNKQNSFQIVLTD
jgi:hypothetical protein